MRTVSLFATRPFRRVALIVPALWLSAAPMAVTGIVTGIVTGAVTGAVPCWVPPVEAPVTDPFRAPRCEWCPGNRGIEYGPTAGQVVTAVAAIAAPVLCAIVWLKGFLDHTMHPTANASCRKVCRHQPCSSCYGRSHSRPSRSVS